MQNFLMQIKEKNFSSLGETESKNSILNIVAS